MTILGEAPTVSETVVMIQVLEYEELVTFIKKFHEEQGHASIGTTMHDASRKFWHPESILAAYEVIQTCRSCQLMKPPDSIIGNFTPIQPAPPLTRWGIDHTSIGPQTLLHAIEYATGWLESRLVTATDFQNTLPLLMHIINNFGAPKQLIGDNAGFFSGVEARQFYSKHGIKVTHIRPMRPQTTGKAEQANGVLKAILARIFLENSSISLHTLFTAQTQYIIDVYHLIGIVPISFSLALSHPDKNLFIRSILGKLRRRKNRIGQEN